MMFGRYWDGKLSCTYLHLIPNRNEIYEIWLVFRPLIFQILLVVFMEEIFWTILIERNQTAYLNWCNHQDFWHIISSWAFG